MLWRRFSTSCSFYSLTFPAMRTAGVAHNPFLDCVLWLQAAACGLALSSAGGGKWPKGAFRNSSGSQEDSLIPPQKSLGGISAYSGVSGFAQHVSATHLPPANLPGTEKRCAFMEKRKALQRSGLERPAAWGWTFLGTEKGIQQTSESQHVPAHCTTINLSPSSRFLASLGFLTSTSIW